MAVEWHFPTPIFVHDFDGEQLEVIQSEIGKSLPTILEGLHNSPWGDNVSTTFERNSKNDIKDYRLDTFKSAIMSALQSYAKTIGYPETDFKMIESWFNICKKNQFQYDHTHSTARVSGCYYVQTSGEDGRIRFANPNQIIHIGRFPADEIELEAITYAPKVGRLLLFPGWLTHRVNVNTSDSERISVAFNFI